MHYERSEGYVNKLKGIDQTSYYFKIISQHKLLSFKEEQHYAKLAKKGDQKALDVLVERNLRLVVKIALSFKAKGNLTLLDLISEGNFGLIKAIKRFEPELGWRLSTYATWWIKEAIDRAIMNHNRMIRVPVHQLKRFNRYYMERMLLTDHLNREPTQEEMAKKLETTIEDITKIEALAYDTGYLEDMAENGDQLLNVDQENDEDPLDTHLKNIDNTKRVAQFLSYLNERQQRVLMMIYGLNNYSEHSLTQCGLELKISRERVRQIHLESLKKIKKVIEQISVKLAA
ncbi:sigma-70 family RNA polymerase sigma factor [Francisellaceae bacterium]|nr:sigma-70 family RNA polymerase sigma factor [Francisellaceae bacterium]